MRNGKSMKKRISLLLMLAFSTAWATAQTDDFRKFRMGFKASPNLSWMQPKDKHFISEGVAGRFGFGFVADVFFAPNYAIGTGVNVIRNGGTLSYLEEEQTNPASTKYILRRTREYSNQYIEVPFSFKLRTNEIGYITYWAQFGFGAGVSIGARGDDTRDYLFEQVVDNGNLSWVTSEERTAFDENADLSNSISLFRASMILAAGIEYNLAGSTSVLVGITYNNGLTNSFSRQDVLRTENDGPIFNGTNPETVRLNAAANALELNIGIMF